jgi:hypothetical protein
MRRTKMRRRKMRRRKMGRRKMGRRRRSPFQGLKLDMRASRNAELGLVAAHSQAVDVGILFEPPCVELKTRHHEVVSVLAH